MSSPGKSCCLKSQMSKTMSPDKHYSICQGTFLQFISNPFTMAGVSSGMSTYFSTRAANLSKLLSISSQTLAQSPGSMILLFNLACSASRHFLIAFPTQITQYSLLDNIPWADPMFASVFGSGITGLFSHLLQMAKLSLLPLPLHPVSLFLSTLFLFWIRFWVKQQYLPLSIDSNAKSSALS